jgi:hypothetical protein
MILKQGSQGPEVEQLQLRLKAAGYDPGDIDGDYGPRTAAAVLAFQVDRPDLEDDGVVGPHTIAALNAATVKKAPDKPTPPAAAPVPCEATTWAAWLAFVDKITRYPVRYGPGRGLWVGDRFVVSHGPGALGSKSWPSALGHSFPSFHCTSWLNFALSWLLRRNEDYTHAGNIPELWDLMAKDSSIHQNPGAGPYRGFGDACYPIAPDGSGAARSGVAKVVDAKELLARRADLPTFVACGQSTKLQSGWLWWHHVVLYVVDHRDGDRLYRIAADGYKGAQGYSGDPMRWVEITDKNVGQLGAAVYRAYGVQTLDGTYGDLARPIAEVGFEAA